MYRLDRLLSLTFPPMAASLRRLALVLGICAAAPSTVAAQVTYFNQPPTVDQLRSALLPTAPGAGAAPALPPGTRTRGIVLEPEGTKPSAATAQTVAGGATAAATTGGGAPAAALPINFDLGSSRVDRESLPYIERIASLMRSDPGLQLVVEGHTDDRGSLNRNMVLSWDRAVGVYRALVETYGVDATRLELLGKGPLEPLPGTTPRDGANRRVQFRIKG